MMSSNLMQMREPGRVEGDSMYGITTTYPNQVHIFTPYRILTNTNLRNPLAISACTFVLGRNGCESSRFIPFSHLCLYLLPSFVLIPVIITIAPSVSPSSLVLGINVSENGIWHRSLEKTSHDLALNSIGFVLSRPVNSSLHPVNLSNQICPNIDRERVRWTQLSIRVDQLVREMWAGWDRIDKDWMAEHDGIWQALNRSKISRGGRMRVGK